MAVPFVTLCETLSVENAITRETIERSQFER